MKNNKKVNRQESYARKVESKRSYVKNERFYLSTIIEKEQITFGQNNLIISPVGSGKTNVILNLIKELREGGITKPALSLVSTTSLKRSVVMDFSKNQSLKVIKDVMTMTEEQLEDLILVDEKSGVIIMTYSKFGKELLSDLDDSYLNSFSDIFCDEIHSLFDYAMSFRTPELFFAIKAVMRSYEDRRVFYFTATDEKLNLFKGKYANLMTNINEENTYNFTNREDIIEHKALSNLKYNLVSELEEMIKKYFNNEGQMHEAFDKSDFKGIVFTEKIDEMIEFVELLERLGFSSICLWSENNKNKPLNDKQKKVMKVLLETGIIPDEYDFVIFNGALREGWNLLDTRVSIAIMNTVDPTNYIQALGRARKSVNLVFSLTKDEKIVGELEIPEVFLNTNLNAEMKDELREFFNVREIKGKRKGELVTFAKLCSYLINQGYSVEHNIKQWNSEKKKPESCSVITKK